VLPVIKRLKEETNAILSIDTIRAEVADEAVKNGIHIINDIWGFQENKGLAIVAANPCCNESIRGNKIDWLPSTPWSIEEIYDRKNT